MPKDDFLTSKKIHDWKFEVSALTNEKVSALTLKITVLSALTRISALTKSLHLAPFST